jgi:hypothetical protein
MPDLINAVIIVVFSVGIIVILGTLCFLAWWQVSNSQFYSRWQRKRRERMAERFVNSIKRRNVK